MELETVISILRKNRETLTSRGIKHIAVFGSLARGEANSESDVDLAVDLNYDMKLGISDFHLIREYIADLLKTDVDLVSVPVRFKPRLQAAIERDRVAAF